MTIFSEVVLKTLKAQSNLVIVMNNGTQSMSAIETAAHHNANLIVDIVDYHRHQHHHDISQVQQQQQQLILQDSANLTDFRLNSKKLYEQYEMEFYAILCHMVIGLTLNCTIFCSIGINIKQRQRSTLNREYRNQKYATVPVIDTIVALLSVIAILRIMCRSALQVACFYGICIVDVFCYVQGFFNTFLHYIYLWTMALFIQDRYIKHYKQHDYLSKCSHFVLYVTLVCVMFLVSMHIFAPIYGFSSYRFLFGELTCSIDWNSSYSCSYYVYSVILVSGPAFVPIAYWTIRLTYKYWWSHFLRQLRGSTFMCFSCCRRARPPNQTSLAETGDVLMTGRSDHTVVATNSHEYNLTVSAQGSNPNDNCAQPSSNRHLYSKSNDKPNNGAKLSRCVNTSNSFNSRYVSASCAFSPSSSSSVTKILSRSQVMTESKELKTVTICSWLFVLSYTPKMLTSACQACSLWNESFNNEHKLFFYITYLDETAAYIMIPFVFVVFHSKLRFALFLCFDFWIQLCCSQSTKPSNKRRKSRHSDALPKNSTKRGKTGEGSCMSSVINRSLSLSSATTSFHTNSNLAASHEHRDIVVTAI